LQKPHNTHALLILNSLPNIDLQKQIHVSKIKNTLSTINSFTLLKMGDTPSCVAAVAKTNSLGFAGNTAVLSTESVVNFIA
jgi:hypothetical protein